MAIPGACAAAFAGFGIELHASSFHGLLPPKEHGTSDDETVRIIVVTVLSVALLAAASDRWWQPPLRVVGFFVGAVVGSQLALRLTGRPESWTMVQDLHAKVLVIASILSTVVGVARSRGWTTD